MGDFMETLKPEPAENASGPLEQLQAYFDTVAF